MATANAPSVSTMIRTKLSDGRLLGIEGDMWLVRKLPLEPVADAKSIEERMNVYMPLMAAYEELAALANTTGNRRSMSRGSYRQVQLLLVNVAKLYNPSGHKIAGFLKESFPTQATEQRVALLAVRLVAKVGANGGWRKALDSVVETLVSGGTPLSDFDDDYRKVDAAMARSGLSTPTAQELSMANSWWNQANFPDTVDLAHDDHLHIFADTKAVRMANDAGREDCKKWPKIPKHHALTFATLEDFNFEFESSESTAAHWATGLVEDGAVAISIRGSIEPAKVTRAELRRQRKRYMDDINERHKNHKMEDARQEEMLKTLEAVEEVYAAGGSPTLVDASVLVAFNGEIDDITQAAPRSAANLRTMNFRQRQALAEMMLCSAVRANPNLHDLPIQTVACSGIQSLSTVGDKEGALLGFTERDNQPAYESPTAASSGDAAPIFVNLGATGSGKATSLSTRIPTPTGWTTMGELEIGSEVIGRDGKPCRVTFLSDINDAPELYKIVFSDGQVVEADFDHQWVVSNDFDRQGGHRGKNARRQEIWDDSRVLLGELEALAAAYDENHEADLNQLFDIVTGFVTVSPWASVGGIRAALKFVDAPFRYVPTSQWTGSAAGGKCRVYNTAVALKSLHQRVTQQHHGRDSSVQAERRMTTGEIIAAGVRKASDGGSYPRFAVHVAGALDLPEANLPLDPYVLGAWLGDGTTGEGTMASAATASCTDEFGVTDQSVMMQQFAEFCPTPRPSRPEFVFGTRGLVPKLREAGVLHNKHIPAAYLRGSAEQRLALLQGLMDTDGTVNGRTGEIKIGMNRKALMDQILDLIRSLGIKAGPVRSFETIRNQPLADGTFDVRVGEMHEVSFRTDKPVFRLPRKLAKMRRHGPKVDWIYIESIEKIDPVPARCIQVDSPDHTYLVGDYIPTSNTMVLLWKALQFAKLGGPQVIIDPKALALDTPIPTPTGWTTMGEINVGDQVIGRDGAPCNVVHKSRIFTTDETHLYEFVFDDGQVIRADQNHQWVVTSPKDRTALKEGRGRTEAELASFANSADVLALSTSDADVDTTSGLLGRLQSAGVDRWSHAAEIRAILNRQGVVSETDSKPFRWPAGVALKALAAHLHEEASMGTDKLRVLTTENLLEHGVQHGKASQTYWAVPVPEAVQYPEADLPVDPYLFGAWLGDGTSKAGSICSGSADADEMRGLLQSVWPLPVTRTDDVRGLALFSFPRDASLCKRGHSDFVPTTKNSVRCRACGAGKAEGDLTNGSLGDLLSELGVLGNKHIPAHYLRGSIEQRLALLQGLMDTDGTVHVKRSELRITLTNRELAGGVLTLVRSLGIKAHWHESPARIVFQDEHGEKVRKDCGTAYSITFRTDLPVFRLARKKAIQPKASFRAGFSYIKEIRPVESAEAQCIRVDSPDHTYLVGDYIVTHNTGSDHSPTVLAHGGQVASLDDLKEADGIFDPLRFSHNPTVGVELAVSMLASIDPWGGKASEYEVKLYTALSYGVSKGANCVGQALRIADQDGKASRELVDPIFELADTSPLFRACVGVDPRTKALSINEGITLIKVGNTHLDLPEPGAMKQASVMQKVSLALVRMMVFGSAMALTGRGGAIHLDEAWVFLGAGKAEVERLGRLARSQQVLPELYTQRASDPLKAGLAGYISRGLILPIEDKDEARAALELFKLEATDDRLSRITGKAMLGEGGTVAPNWNSMRALRDPATKKVLRGTVGYYSDLAGRCVPVQIVLPPAFLKLASTNADDLNERKRELALPAI